MVILGLNSARSGFQHSSSFFHEGAQHVEGFHSIELLVGSGQRVCDASWELLSCVWPCLVSGRWPCFPWFPLQDALCLSSPNHPRSGPQAPVTAEIWGKGSFWTFS